MWFVGRASSGGGTTAGTPSDDSASTQFRAWYRMSPFGTVRSGTPAMRETWAPAVYARMVSRASRNARCRTTTGSGSVHAAGSGEPRQAPNSFWSSARVIWPMPNALSNRPAVVLSLGATGRARVGHPAPRLVDLDGGQMGTGHWLLAGRNAPPKTATS